MIAIGTSCSFPTASLPLCPSTVDWGKFGMSPYEMVMGSSTRLAIPPNPEPSTTAIFGVAETQLRRNSAASVARSKSSVLKVSLKLLTHQYADNRRRHQVRHGSSEHCTQAEAGEIVAPCGRQCADAANLHANGAKICKTAQGERGNGKRTHIHCCFLRAQHGVGDQFVDDHARSQKV